MSESAGNGTGLRVDHIDIAAAVLIRTQFPGAGEQDAPPIRRPGRQVLVELRIPGQGLEPFTLDIDQRYTCRGSLRACTR